MLKKESPYELNSNIDDYVRKVVFAQSAVITSVTLKADVNVEKVQALAKTKGVSVVTVFIKAVAKVMSEFPKLNYYTFWGKLAWGGEHTRITVVYEEESNEAVNYLVVADGESKSLEEIQSEINAVVKNDDKRIAKKTLWNRFMNSFPWLSFWLMRVVGKEKRDYMKNFGPVIFSSVNTPGIKEMTVGGVFYVSSFIAPGRIENGKCSITLSFNHQVANARPFANLLSRMKEIIENWQ